MKNPIAAHRRPPQAIVRRGVVIGLLVAVSVSGCGRASELEVHRVHGRVTFAGAPVKSGAVTLRAEGGETPWHRGVGSIDGTGHYEIYTSGQQGAPVGTYRVTVFASESAAPGEAHPGLPKSSIPVKYNQFESTPLRIEVQPAPAGKEPEYPLELTP